MSEELRIPGRQAARQRPITVTDVQIDQLAAALNGIGERLDRATDALNTLRIDLVSNYYPRQEIDRQRAQAAADVAALVAAIRADADKRDAATRAELERKQDKAEVQITIATLGKVAAAIATGTTIAVAVLKIVGVA